MKKILLVATVLVGGIAISQAGINVSIGIGLPLPHHRPAVVIRHPVTYCPPPVYVAPPLCPPRVVISHPRVYYRPAYGYPLHSYRGHDRYDRHDHHDRYSRNDRHDRDDRGRSHRR